MPLHKVLQLLREVPHGMVTTYGALARAAGTSPRAVGSIMHSNADTSTHPCYKVVMSNGRLGGYASGTKKKIAKLRSDGIKVDKGHVQKSNSVCFTWD